MVLWDERFRTLQETCEKQEKNKEENVPGMKTSVKVKSNFGIY